MSRDPRAEGLRWVAQAEHDLSDGQFLAGGNRHAMACFLAQQAAEMALKGLLYSTGADRVFGHGVGALCEEVARAAPEAAERCAEWAGLDVYYQPTRYPDSLPSGIPATTFTERQASAALELAAEVLTFVRSKIPDP
ncbi:MAG: HEPN domain-containing protein [Acidimicrobiia bacterium]